MTEVLCEIRARQSGKDTLWKSAMRRRKAKTGDAVGRSSWRSPFLGAPGADFFAGWRNLLGQGRRRPCPKIPSILGRQKEDSSYCKCAQQICLTAGVHPKTLCPILCPPYIKNHSRP